MGYTFTIADVAIIIIVSVICTVLAFYVITDDGPPVPSERTYRFGENATRIHWNADSGIHEIAVRLERNKDKWPQVGDTVAFIEEGGTRFRAKILEIPHTVKLGGSRPQVLLAVKPLIRG